MYPMLVPGLKARANEVRVCRGRARVPREWHKAPEPCSTCRPQPSLRRRGVQAHNGGVTAKHIKLDPQAPGLDDATRVRRRALAKMQEMSGRELFALAVRAGIYTET